LSGAGNALFRPSRPARLVRHQTVSGLAISLLASAGAGPPRASYRRVFALQAAFLVAVARRVIRAAGTSAKA